MSVLSQIGAAVLDGLLSPIACQTYVGLAVFLAVVLILDLRAGRGIDRYLVPGFRTDVFYTLLIVGGIYGLIQLPLLSWIDSILRHQAFFLYLDVLKDLPEWIQLVMFLIAVDFCRYWKHRLMHSVPVLMLFHSIHHGAEELNFLTRYRIHLVDYLIDGVITLLPVILLGTPPHIWLPVNLMLLWFGCIHHSDIDLSFGPLDRIFVSPRFHSVHHSSDPSDYDTNFGAALSIWDILFGTARFTHARPLKYGLVGLKVPPSFLGQLFFPAQPILDHIRARWRPSAPLPMRPTSSGSPQLDRR